MTTTTETNRKLEYVTEQYLNGEISLLDLINYCADHMDRASMPGVARAFLAIRGALIGDTSMEALHNAKHVMLANTHHIEIPDPAFEPSHGPAGKVQGAVSSYKTPAFWPNRERARFLALSEDLADKKASRLMAVVDLGFVAEGEDRSGR